jgi:aspartyl-tRNA(Asn)/glutamyl-tRNA(Gln) amidotransferase subunit B
VKAGGDPKRLCNLITQIGLKITKEKNCGITDLPVSPKSIADLTRMVENNMISASSAAAIFDAMTQTGKQPDVLANELNLVQKSDVGELGKIIDQVIAENPEAVADVTSGGKKEKKARGFLMGQVMQKSKGQANPKVVSEILAKKLG